MVPDPAGNGPRFAHQQTFCAALARQYIAQLFGKLCDCSAGSDAADEVWTDLEREYAAIAEVEVAS